MAEPADIALDHSLARLGPDADTQARLEVLRHLLVYWLGDQPIDPYRNLPPMPEVLATWFSLVGKDSNAASGQNILREPEPKHPQFKLGIDDDDLLFFYMENQGCWLWGTDRLGDDPPVYGRESDRQPWTSEGRCLSEHLITSVLFQRLLDAPCTAFTGWVKEDVLSVVETHVPRLPIAPWRWPTAYSAFHAGRGAFAMINRDAADDRKGGGLYVAAKHREALAFLDDSRVDWDFRGF